jgi:hypothetical protein
MSAAKWPALPNGTFPALIPSERWFWKSDVSCTGMADTKRHRFTDYIRGLGGEPSGHKRYLLNNKGIEGIRKLPSDLNSFICSIYKPFK